MSSMFVYIMTSLDPVQTPPTTSTAMHILYNVFNNATAVPSRHLRRLQGGLAWRQQYFQLTQDVLI